MNKQYLLGFDVGSSSVKASLVDAETGAMAATAFFPEHEAPIKAVKPGWAEQNPQMWWDNAKLALQKIMAETGAKGEDIKAIGISYQMHGLVVVDKELKPLRDAIIWCDSRAVPYGERAFNDLGNDYCLQHLLNSPGNFTAAKLAWVKDNEPDVFDHIYKIMLPGDYIAMRLSGEPNTTIGGLSEGILWDFVEKKPSEKLMDYFGFPHDILPDIVPTFAVQSQVCESLSWWRSAQQRAEPQCSSAWRDCFYRRNLRCRLWRIGRDRLRQEIKSEHLRPRQLHPGTNASRCPALHQWYRHSQCMGTTQYCTRRHELWI